MQNNDHYEYEFVKLLCKELKVGLKLHVAPNLTALLEMLEDYQVDLVAYRVPYTEENKEKVEFTKREYITNQVLVQCKSDTMVTDVLHLTGKQITVVPNSIYSKRIHFLNDEIGGGIDIIYSSDTSKVEDLIADVAHHRISYTFAEKDGQELKLDLYMPEDTLNEHARIYCQVKQNIFWKYKSQSRCKFPPTSCMVCV